jgi:hypothetical protein
MDYIPNHNHKNSKKIVEKFYKEVGFIGSICNLIKNQEYFIDEFLLSLCVHKITVF